MQEIEVKDFVAGKFEHNPANGFHFVTVSVAAVVFV